MTTTRADHVMMARVYLGQAREQNKHPGWRATLLKWAGDRRRAAMSSRSSPAQAELF